MLDRCGRQINFIVASPSNGSPLVRYMNGAKKLRIVAQRSIELVCQDYRREINRGGERGVDVTHPGYSDREVAVRLNRTNLRHRRPDLDNIGLAHYIFSIPTRESSDCLLP